MIWSSSLNRFLLTLLMPVLLFFIGLTQTYATELNLSWLDNSNDERGFYIERSPGESGPFVNIATLEPNSTSYVDSSVSNGFRYCYMVVAFNSNDSSASNVACSTVSQPSTMVDSITLSESILLSDNFEGYGAGADPDDWKDTEKNNSFIEDPALFETIVLKDTTVFGTYSTETNIHSHYNGPEAVRWTNYIYTGRMYITDPNGGPGVTFFSHFPDGRDVYYRLRRYAQRPDFHIAPHGTSIKGDVNSGVSPKANIWYQFLIEVEDTGVQTNIRAKIWKDGESEPDGFQIDAYDNSDTRSTEGPVGIWSMGPGGKYFDDIKVEPRL